MGSCRNTGRHPPNLSRSVSRLHESEKLVMTEFFFFPRAKGEGFAPTPVRARPDCSVGDCYCRMRPRPCAAPEDPNYIQLLVELYTPLPTRPHDARSVPSLAVLSLIFHAAKGSSRV